ncbi:MAG: ferrous iron transport protein A [Arenimonas sp.]|nr:ferrous iron transport protein A [Arenimonas sp.]MBP6627318.1 ferrous iron transport protein A [Arenimonas sp.]
MTLSELPSGIDAIVDFVQDKAPGDSIARRLRDLGFVSGEAVKLLARGPLGGEPLLVQVGYTRFAMRGGEAARVRLRRRDG